MSPEVFSSLQFYPNPVPGSDDHNESFEEIYGQRTSDKHRSSLQQKKCKSSYFSPSQQHVKNAKLLVQCEECDEWQLLFCKHMLCEQEVSRLDKILDDVLYTIFDDLDLPDLLANVFVKDHRCHHNRCLSLGLLCTNCIAIRCAVQCTNSSRIQNSIL